MRIAARFSQALTACVMAAFLGLPSSASAQLKYELFAGELRSSSSAPLTGTVTINNVTVNAVDGYFELYVPAAESFLIRANAAGHVPYSKAYSGPAMESMTITLLAAESITVDPRQQINVMDSRGTRIVIPANSMVDSQGRLAVGPLQLSLRTFDLRNEEMIGDMTGINAQGQSVRLESLGAFSAIFTDSSGNRYNLMSGRTASISMPVDPANTYSGPVPLWHFDEQRGTWVERAMGRVENGIATGQVPHFSAWNFDMQFTNSACTWVSVSDNAFSPPGFPWPNPVNLTIRVLNPGWPSTRVLTIPQPRLIDAATPRTATRRNSGYLLFALPPNTTVEVLLDGVLYDVYNTGAAWTGPVSTSSTLIPLDRNQCNSALVVDGRTPKIATLRGTALRQHRSNHAGITITVSSNGLTASTTTDAAGSFSVAVRAGTATATAARAGYISTTRSGIPVAPGATVTLNTAILRAGDTNGDNRVDWSPDITSIGNALGLSVSSTDLRDINGNLVIDNSDVNFAAGNLGVVGPLPWP